MTLPTYDRQNNEFVLKNDVKINKYNLKQWYKVFSIREYKVTYIHNQVIIILPL